LSCSFDYTKEGHLWKNNKCFVFKLSGTILSTLSVWKNIKKMCEIKKNCTKF
jgi:hypothetical protein